MSKHTDTRKAAELLRDRLQIERQATDREVAEQTQRLREQLGPHATSAVLSRVARDVRNKRATKVEKDARDLLARAAACREIRAALDDRASLLLTLPAAPESFIAFDDVFSDSGKRAKLQIQEARLLRAEIARQRFEQRLTRYPPAALATLAAQAAAADDRESVIAIHAEIHARVETEPGVGLARMTINTLASELPLPKYLQAEVEDLDVIDQAAREISQSLEALKTGNEAITVAEAIRETDEAIAAGEANPGAAVGQRRAARAMGRTVPPIDIPINRDPNPTPADTAA
jgi:hypothetical protein